MWTVLLSSRARKNRRELPTAIEAAFKVLLAELEYVGPNRANWANYSKLGSQTHHCHIKKGRPTYVAVWRVEKGQIRIIEVTYVGTHEKAPY
ncbi:MAG: cytotoxic translational repressor of toxin-antitoxin stability system [Desulfovibrionaceae bacterium]|nr:cytotoxic translational repressor of toxin-antitoxin stability system [Desulfovibrionaceae bacterium]